MRKLKLEIEDLAVESFATGAGADGPGTVRGRAGAFAGYGVVTDPVEDPVEEPVPATSTCPVVTYCASCVNTCDACTYRTCPSGGEICCA